MGQLDSSMLRAQAVQLQAQANAVDRLNQLRQQAAQLTQQADQIEASLPRAKGGESQPVTVEIEVAAEPEPSVAERAQSEWENGLRAFYPDHPALPENQPENQPQQAA